MKDRITIKQLSAQVERLNRLTGQPLEPYVREDDGTEHGRFAAQIGNYHVSQAYGGVRLHQMATPGGGVRDVLSLGYCSKRELYDRLLAFIEGIETANGNRTIREPDR